MRPLIDALLSILLAPECAACGQPLAEPSRGAVCRPCWNSIPCIPVTGHGVAAAVAENLAVAGERRDGLLAAIDGGGAAGLYDGSLRQIIHALKYDGRRSLARPLAGLMRERNRDLVAAAGVAIPVPLHPSRRRQRGFNQSLDLARHLGLPVVTALKRQRRTRVQAELPAADRSQNVAGAFVATPLAGALLGRSVVLIDDVSTTGSTLAACALALKAAGVGRVYALTAARAVLSPR